VALAQILLHPTDAPALLRRVIAGRLDALRPERHDPATPAIRQIPKLSCQIRGPESPAEHCLLGLHGCAKGCVDAGCTEWRGGGRGCPE
jgi:hypothetical protein